MTYLGQRLLKLNLHYHSEFLFLEERRGIVFRKLNKCQNQISVILINRQKGSHLLPRLHSEFEFLNEHPS